MKIKQGVILNGLKLQMRKVLINAERIWQDFGQELVITSGLEGTHSAGSVHYYGYALDLRTRYFSTEDTLLVVEKLMIELGPHYIVLLEDTHIHVEWRYANELAG